jgi:hypothetical protein
MNTQKKILLCFSTYIIIILLRKINKNNIDCFHNDSSNKPDEHDCIIPEFSLCSDDTSNKLDEHDCITPDLVSCSDDTTSNKLEEHDCITPDLVSCTYNTSNKLDGSNCPCANDELLIKITKLDNKCVNEMNERRNLIKCHVRTLKEHVNAYCKSKNISSNYKKMICLLRNKRKTNTEKLGNLIVNLYT